jgi:hypothetical protein
MKTLKTMTKDERSQLLYFETRAVDCGGRVNGAHMNAADMEIAKRWNAEGFVGFGRIASEHINSTGSYWCNLSDEAWALAAAERKARGERNWKKRDWWSTEEKRAA